ncbi:MAG: hypothetical protein GX459_03175 [Bacteroidales bacterium]|nr:hypothetical protein [Bacteroidales bacterium]
MKAILKIECIGDNYDQNLRFWKNITTQLAGKQLAEATFGKSKASYFVAEIIGFNDKYRYERIFLSCQKDYKDSNGTGSRKTIPGYKL